MVHRRHALLAVLSSASVLVPTGVRADAADQLRQFVRDVSSGRARFTQTVTSVEGGRQKVSSGSFEFVRPNRFRFTYEKPFEQVIVADGRKVWIYDADLNQASSRPLAKALGNTPAALLAGGAIDEDFMLAAQPSTAGIDWVQATPRTTEGSFKHMRVGFMGKTLAQVEIVDSFGQRSLLQFTDFVANPGIAADRFRFVPPAGADVIEQ